MEHTAARLRALGIDVPLGERFACCLPGHNRHEARVHVTPRDGHVHLECGRDSWGLAEVRAFLGYGGVRRISPVQAARWRERLDYDAGLLTPRPVPVELPDGASEGLRRIADGWSLHVGLRDPRWGDEPFTFARSFVMAWCRVTDEQARYGVERLEQLGIMHRVGARREGAYQSILWLPAGAAALGLRPVADDRAPCLRVAEGQSAEERVA